MEIINCPPPMAWKIELGDDPCDGKDKSAQHIEATEITIRCKRRHSLPRRVVRTIGMGIFKPCMIRFFEHGIPESQAELGGGIAQEHVSWLKFQGWVCADKARIRGATRSARFWAPH